MSVVSDAHFELQQVVFAMSTGQKYIELLQHDRLHQVHLCPILQHWRSTLCSVCKCLFTVNCASFQKVRTTWKRAADAAQVTWLRGP